MRTATGGLLALFVLAVSAPALASTVEGIRALQSVVRGMTDLGGRSPSVAARLRVLADSQVLDQIPVERMLERARNRSVTDPKDWTPEEWELLSGDPALQRVLGELLLLDHGTLLALRYQRLGPSLEAGAGQMIEGGCAGAPVGACFRLVDAVRETSMRAPMFGDPHAAHADPVPGSYTLTVTTEAGEETLHLWLLERWKQPDDATGLGGMWRATLADGRSVFLTLDEAGAVTDVGMRNGPPFQWTLPARVASIATPTLDLQAGVDAAVQSAAAIEPGLYRFPGPRHYGRRGVMVMGLTELGPNGLPVLHTRLGGRYGPEADFELQDDFKTWTVRPGPYARLRLTIEDGKLVSLQTERLDNVQGWDLSHQYMRFGYELDSPIWESVGPPVKAPPSDLATQD